MAPEGLERRPPVKSRHERSLTWTSDERRLDLVFFLEGDLVIAGVTVKEGEQFAAGGGVYNLVYLRQTKGVFRAVFVKISVINAHSPFFIVFLNKNGVC